MSRRVKGNTWYSFASVATNRIDYAYVAGGYRKSRSLKVQNFLITIMMRKARAKSDCSEMVTFAGSVGLFAMRGTVSV